MMPSKSRAQKLAIGDKVDVDVGVDNEVNVLSTITSTVRAIGRWLQRKSCAWKSP